MRNPQFHTADPVVPPRRLAPVLFMAAAAAAACGGGGSTSSASTGGSIGSTSGGTSSGGSSSGSSSGGHASSSSSSSSGGTGSSGGSGSSGSSSSSSSGGSSSSSSSSGGVSSLPTPYLKYFSTPAYGSTVNVYLDGSTVVIESNDIPNHKSPYFGAGDYRYEADTNSGFSANPNSIAAQTLTFRIPAQPTPAGSPQATPLGPIGVALNGVPLFNQYAAGRAPLTGEVVSFDQYGGHPQQSNQYHYHVEPLALTAQYGKSALLGYLLDGYPVYGPMEDGVTLTSADLDVYHGHFKATADYPAGVYHYHVTADSPYINGDGFYGVAGTVSQ